MIMLRFLLLFVFYFPLRFGIMIHDLYYWDGRCTTNLFIYYHLKWLHGVVDALMGMVNALLEWYICATGVV